MILEVWETMGFMRYPLTFSLGVVFILATWSATQVMRPNATPDLATKAWMDGILFWGGFAMIAGVLGTLIGIIIAAQSIEMAGEVSSVLVWGGVKVALLTSLFGMLIFAFSALSWFFLQLRWRLLIASDTEF